jgi:catechol 2,3-dioxygenase-like lactoylglutathione lyase family enzyme
MLAAVVRPLSATACAVAAPLLFTAALLGAQAAAAQGIPSLRGQDHTGITVPDLKQAVDFFVNVVGCKEAVSFGPLRDDKGNFIADTLAVNPRAVIEKVTMVTCGVGSNIEMFQYKAPGQVKKMPRNSDYGGHHIAFYVDDIDAAAAYLKSKGVKVLAGPLPVTEGGTAGQTINYFQTPWGMSLEIISYPNGMAYEKTSPNVMWSPRTAK